MLQFGARVVGAYIYPVAFWFAQDVLGRGIMIGGNCFIRKSALADIGGFNTAIEFWGDDTDTAIRLAEKGRIVYGADVFAKTSARRYYEEGIFKTLWGYTFHAARVSAHALRAKNNAVNSKARM